MSKQLLVIVSVVSPDGEVLFVKNLYVDADLMHPADDPAITLRGVRTAIDYVLSEERKRG